MKSILVACETIEDEVKGALARLGLDYPVIWLEGGLHDSPDRLRARMKEILDEADGNCERLLLTLGYCGGGVSDLTTGRYTTIVPLADDCLSLLLGSMRRRLDISNEAGTIFLTSGWMRHENGMINMYESRVEKYGQARADRVNKMMLQHYKRFGLVDTGCYDLLEASGKVALFAERMELKVETMDGSNSWLDTLLTGPYDDPGKFLVIPPESELNFGHWQKLLDEVAKPGAV
ncbi:hypothetical protein C4J81_05490 [Deltaproteobacteria bacterium Smac51]|nr:hypothetical protein C4J81_05490 [Deltaproteobacteria bacterium Smac51]